MTITLYLTPEQEARLAARARAAGVSDPAEFVLRLIEGADLALSNDETDPMLELFAQWDREDANMTAEEVENEAAKWEELKAAINTDRKRVGAEPAF